MLPMAFCLHSCEDCSCIQLMLLDPSMCRDKHISLLSPTRKLLQITPRLQIHQIPQGFPTPYHVTASRLQNWDLDDVWFFLLLSCKHGDIRMILVHATLTSTSALLHEEESAILVYVFFLIHSKVLMALRAWLWGISRKATQNKNVWLGDAQSRRGPKAEFYRFDENLKRIKLSCSIQDNVSFTARPGS